jgi:hypothetical protein
MKTLFAILFTLPLTGCMATANVKPEDAEPVNGIEAMTSSAIAEHLYEDRVLKVIPQGGILYVCFYDEQIDEEPGCIMFQQTRQGQSI